MEALMSTLANTDNIQAWSDFQTAMVAANGEEGHAARRYVLNPVLFELFGELAGKAVLDAGCGTGYLARLCAKRGAHVTGIEPAPATPTVDPTKPRNVPTFGRSQR
jgi:2-polyprenyl-3-methyl-5-hydroxy-6-metoxy-1,4-benzoquinol methylase